MRENERGKGGSVKVRGGGDKVTHFREAAHNGDNCVVAVVSHGESNHEVHGDALPCLQGMGSDSSRSRTR